MEINLCPGTQCRLTLLNTTYPANAMTAGIEDVTGLQVHLRIPSALSFADPVKIEADGAVVLGDVTHCHPAESGFTIGVTIRHTLSALPELTRLNEALSEEADVPVSPTPLGRG